MRKDVKLGMAIGGGLIAVLIGYLLFAPPSTNNKKGTQLAAGNGSIIDPSSPGDLTQGSDADKVAAPAGKPDAAATPQAQPTPTNNGGASTDKPASPANGGKTADPVKTDDKDKPKADWNNVLDKGKSPTAPAAKETITANAGKSHKTTDALTVAEGHGTPTATHQGQLYVNPNEAWGGGLSTDGVGASHTSGGRALATVLEATKPNAAGAGTHVVQQGETLSSIALAAYGSSTLYPHILRANPNVNPNNLKLGTALNMPKLDEVKAATATEQSAKVANIVVQDAKIDPTTQYRVQSGDSLYKISLKVYGKSSYVDRIYDKNKTAIGADPKRLKLGMVLELPEKAASASATPSDTTASTLNDGNTAATEENQAK